MRTALKIQLKYQHVEREGRNIAWCACFGDYVLIYTGLVCRYVQAPLRTGLFTNKPPRHVIVRARAGERSVVQGSLPKQLVLYVLPESHDVGCKNAVCSTNEHVAKFVCMKSVDPFLQTR